MVIITPNLFSNLSNITLSISCNYGKTCLLLFYTSLEIEFPRKAVTCDNNKFLCQYPSNELHIHNELI